MYVLLITSPKHLTSRQQNQIFINPNKISILIITIHNLNFISKPFHQIPSIIHTFPMRIISIIVYDIFFSIINPFITNRAVVVCTWRYIIWTSWRAYQLFTNLTNYATPLSLIFSIRS